MNIDDDLNLSRFFSREYDQDFLQESSYDDWNRKYKATVSQWMVNTSNFQNFNLVNQLRMIKSSKYKYLLNMQLKNNHSKFNL